MPAYARPSPPTQGRLPTFHPSAGPYTSTVSDAARPPPEDAFAPVRAWLASRGLHPFAFQEEVWAAFARGESGLIHAPTGMGKTYAAALPAMVVGSRGAADDPPPLALLWVTPLRALAGDTGLALAEAARALAPHWTVGRAHGRHAATRRARARRGGCPRYSSPRRRASRCSCRAPIGANASRT